MFPSIDNNMGIASVRQYLDEGECKDLPADCAIEVLVAIILYSKTLITCRLMVQLKDFICLALMQI